MNIKFGYFFRFHSCELFGRPNKSNVSIDSTCIYIIYDELIANLQLGFHCHSVNGGSSRPLCSVQDKTTGMVE